MTSFALGKIFWKKKSVLPGFNLAMGITLVYLSLIVLIPLSTLFFRTATVGWSRFIETATTPRALASYGLSFGASLVAATNQRCLRRHRRVGACPLSLLRQRRHRRPRGSPLRAPHGGRRHRAHERVLGQGLGRAAPRAVRDRGRVQPARRGHRARLRGLPFVVRTVQPVLSEMDLDEEEGPRRSARPGSRPSGG